MKIMGLQKVKMGKTAKKFRLKLIMAFGSQVNGKTHPKSDLDIAVLFPSGDFTFKKYGELHSSLLDVFPGYEVDMVILNRADPLLLKKINENPLLLFGEKRDFDEFRIYAFNRYEDYRPYLAMEEKIVDNLVTEMRNEYRQGSGKKKV